MFKKITFFFILLSLLSSLGCGKKQWPEPNVAEETFSIKYVDCTRTENCWRIKAQISGAVNNLSHISLQAQEIGEDFDCPACPFRVSHSFDFSLNDPQIELENNNLHLQVCKLDSKKQYRFKLIGSNIYSKIQDVESRVFNPENQ
ncbi:MAG: hypothetical protein ACQES5_11785 [Thermodesulfobacteriota bacterium]